MPDIGLIEIGSGSIIEDNAILLSNPGREVVPDHRGSRPARPRPWSSATTSPSARSPW